MKTPPIEQLPFLLDQLNEQVNDIKDTAGTIRRMIENDRAKREKMAEQPVNDFAWHDAKKDPPKDGERIIVDTGECEPYFLTYFSNWNIKFKRWTKLPK